jgi:predicted GNAT family acetyltransferase
MPVNRYTSADTFAAAVQPFLEAREAEHNLVLGILSNLLRDPQHYDGAPLMVGVSDAAGRVVGAAIQTPPHNLVLSEVDELDAIADLAAALADEPLPGAVGPPPAVHALAEGWTAEHGGSWRQVREERIYRLSQVHAPEPGAGAARLADESDRETIGRWLVAFEREALDDEVEAGPLARALDAWRNGLRRFWLWEVDGRPVSMVGAGGRTPNGVRIGPVYTPPADRGHGYASRLTAFVSQAMLDEGRTYCFLYTDLGNPTANRIYQAIGYEPVTDALMVSFEAGRTQ